MKAVILEHTPNPEVVIATAAHQCVSSDDAEAYLGKLVRKHPKHANKIIKKALSYGHTSILEHVSFTFSISETSRTLSHQLVRFRIASFSQQSQRYVKGPFGFVVPDTIIAHPEALNDYLTIMEEIDKFYTAFVDDYKIPAEDARFLLPNATHTALVMTMNARELLHFFSLRCCEHAQWEIREMAWTILKLVLPILRVAFENAGPSCFRGVCPEGERCCGGSKHERVA